MRQSSRHGGPIPTEVVHPWFQNDQAQQLGTEARFKLRFSAVTRPDIFFRFFFRCLSIGVVPVRRVGEAERNRFVQQGNVTMNMKKIALYTVGTLAVATAATFALPRTVSIERTATMDAAPEAVLQLAASNTGYQSFNPYKDLDPDLTVEMFGPTDGVGSGFSFVSKDGAGQQTVASVTADTVSFDLDLGPLGQPTQAISAVEVDGATEVTWTMEMDLGMNPIFRVMGLFMDGMIGPNFELGLANIADVAA